MKITVPRLKKIISCLLLAFSLFTALPAQAQIQFPDDDVDDETPTAPIDGFLGLGILAGVYYGIRKLKK